MNLEYIFTLANIVFTIGTLLLSVKVIKNRNMLKDFDVVGSGLTMCALFIMMVGYTVLEMWVAMAFMSPTLIFWIIVTVFSINNMEN